MARAPRPTRKAAERAARDRRLAEALRENLRRRKQQARGKSAPTTTAPTSEDEPPA
jgi:hypothetical protein